MEVVQRIRNSFCSVTASPCLNRAMPAAALAFRYDNLELCSLRAAAGLEEFARAAARRGRRSSIKVQFLLFIK